MVDEGHVGDIVESALAEEARLGEHRLDALGPRFGERDRALFLVLLEVLGPELGDELIHLFVHIRGILGRAGDDERRARLVDEDRIDLVHDGVVERPLDHVLEPELHVVAQVVEAVLVIGAVCHVGGVCEATLLVERPWTMHPTVRPRNLYIRPIHSASRAAR